MWENGVVAIGPTVYEKYFYEAKVYDEPSQWGIDGGRISKLTIRDSRRTIIYQYDRGDEWIFPVDEVAKQVAKVLIKIKEKYQ